MRTLVVLGAASLPFLGACSQDLVLVTDPDHRFPCKGFTVQAPPGDGWRLMREAEDIEREVIFMKHGPTPGHTVMACAFPLPGRFDDADSVMKTLRQRGGHAGHDERLKNRTERGAVEHVDGRPVVVCFQSGEDHGPAGNVDAGATIETRSFTFLDPQTKKAAQLWVSERRPRDVAPLQLDDEVESFARGFRFGSPVN